MFSLGSRPFPLTRYVNFAGWEHLKALHGYKLHMRYVHVHGDTMYAKYRCLGCVALATCSFTNSHLASV